MYEYRHNLRDTFTFISTNTNEGNIVDWETGCVRYVMFVEAVTKE